MIKKIFCKNLKKARENKGYTQQYVADVLCTSQTNITKYEKGTLEPNITMLKQLADLYTITIDELFREE